MISCPDAVFTTAILSQFVLNPGPTHVKALKCLISYLYTTRNCWLTFGGKDVKILMYTDADYAQQADCHSILGYCLIFGAGAIRWSSKKQNIITVSSTKAEYVRHTNAAKEILWICNFWAEINGKSNFDLTLLRADNQGTIQLSNNNKFHARTKHIDVCYHFIREALKNKLLEIKYVPTDENVADIFTKPLSRPLFEKFREMLGLSYTWGVLKLGQALLFTLRTFIHILLFPFISDYRLRSRAILLGLFFYYGLIFLLKAETYVNHLLILLDT